MDLQHYLFSININLDVINIKLFNENQIFEKNLETFIFKILGDIFNTNYYKLITSLTISN